MTERDVVYFEIEGCSISYSYDDSGYPFVLITWPSGTHLKVEEVGQAGDIGVKLNGETVNQPER